MRRLLELLDLSWRKRALLGEAALLLGLARAALAVFPFRHVVGMVGRVGGQGRARPAATAEEIAWALAVAGHHLPWTASCLVRAVAGKVMLGRRGIPATIVLGVRRPA